MRLLSRENKKFGFVLATNDLSYDICYFRSAKWLHMKKQYSMYCSKEFDAVEVRPIFPRHPEFVGFVRDGNAIKYICF